MSEGKNSSFRWRAMSTSIRSGPNGHKTATRSIEEPVTATTV